METYETQCVCHMGPVEGLRALSTPTLLFLGV